MKITREELMHLINEEMNKQIGLQTKVNEEASEESDGEDSGASENEEHQEEESSSTEDTGLRGTTLKLLGRLEGIHVTLKELHWGADKMSEHTLLDTIDSNVLGLLDEVAEVSMGLLDEKFGRGDLKAEACDCSDCAGVLNRLSEVVIDAKKGVGSEDKYAGLQSILDDFLGNINKWNYLRKLD